MQLIIKYKDGHGIYVTCSMEHPNHYLWKDGEWHTDCSDGWFDCLESSFSAIAKMVFKYYVNKKITIYTEM